jgi:hypothetical protein
MTLIELFNTINLPNENDNFQFSAIPIPSFSNHRIAKDKADNPTLLLSISNQGTRPQIANLKLQNVSVLFDIKCKIEQNGNLIEKIFTVVCFIGKDNSLKKYFLKLCSTLVEDLGNAPTQEEVRKEITRFIELFRLAAEPQTKTIQGLWAELFLIAESTEPANLVRCWHCIPEEKFDFNNGEERIEVKSSSNSLRIHNFSLDQLHSPTDTRTIIASVFVKQTSTGKSIATLTNEIADRLSGQIELVEKLQLQVALTLGKSISDSMKLKFDFQLAKDSLKFYKAEDIPKISIDNVPPLVTDVRFKSDLTDLNTIIPNEISTNAGLFVSI